MAYLEVAPDAIDLGNHANKWGHVHELGHNHQLSSWTLPGTGEATNNIFAVHAMVSGVGRRGLGVGGRERWVSEQFAAGRLPGTAGRGNDSGSWREQYNVVPPAFLCLPPSPHTHIHTHTHTLTHTPTHF